jgi:hypothetical protein
MKPTLGQPHSGGETYSPVLCIALKHQRVFRLADLAGIVIFDFLDP